MSNYRTKPVDRWAAVFKALSHPQRLRMVLKLCQGCATDPRCCVGDLGADLGLAASTVSHHLKELRQCGLLEMERCGQRIECWINPGVLRQLTSFLAGAAAPLAAPGGRHAK